MSTPERTDAKLCLLLAVILAAAYAACQNGQWIPGGSDDAYYLTIGRNLLLGRGYVWDGAPVTVSPPGLPMPTE